MKSYNRSRYSTPSIYTQLMDARDSLAKVMKELEDAYMRIESLHKEIDALREPVEEPTFHEHMRESVEFVVNMMNSGKVNPKDVYPKGRYQGD